MTNRDIYNDIAKEISKTTTKKYSTSFSLGINFFSADIRPSIYGIYGFVRFADEIVDTFFDQDQEKLIIDFEKETLLSIQRKFSSNPILHSFQIVVNNFNIPIDLIKSFLNSMKMDIYKETHSEDSYKNYIYGSAEVIGLMCIHVFCKGNDEQIEELRDAAQKLGAAFQKVNFLRDLKDDYQGKGRLYFPELNKNNILDHDSKIKIEKQIESDFNDGIVGIKKLPNNSRLGVYLSYRYFRVLFNKLKKTDAEQIMENRLRINNFRKILLIPSAYLREKTGQFI
ncbi:phytoene/squalene synthase family protein [Candidatus Marinimicrobia bacterium]|nr:phytoene/squalene synthase family protein [Candidatus Neomarinimicrobiota bacterium]|tara:strand:- start:3135 stop:3983 length:849 start_codon:yes stop_codon:yes gene_type:complete